MNPDPSYGKHQGNPESNLAFEKSRAFHGSMRDRILGIIQCSAMGKTSKELAEILKKEKCTFSGRLKELCDSKAIERCGRRDGAAIWVSTKPTRLF